MDRITVTLPDNLHKQVIKIAGKENDSLSYTTTSVGLIRSSISIIQ